MTNAILTLRDPQHVTDLSTCGILVTPIITSTTLTIRDRAAGEDLALDKKANAKAVEVNKKLAAHMAEHRLLQNHRQTVYNGFNVFTYAFAGDQRYLPSVRFEQFYPWWKLMESEHTRLKTAFLSEWPNVRGMAAMELGELFNRHDYPTAEELERKFTIRLVEQPVPQNDFRNVLFHEAMRDAKECMQQHLNEQLEVMLQTQIEQVSTVLKSLSHCCEVEMVQDDNGGVRTKRRKLYDSTLTKAMELCDVFDKFNPTGSIVLRDIRADLMQVLDGVSIEVLRESDTMRTTVKEGVDDILSKYSF